MQAAPSQTDARPGLEARLGRVALHLWARQWLGALPGVVCVTCIGVIAALLLLVLAPRLLFGGALLAAPEALALGGAAGLLAGLLQAARRVRRPSLAETALALESRLAGRDASLSTVLETTGNFQAALAASANLELQAALAAPAPHALATRGLILAPAWLLGAGLFAALAWNAPLADAESLIGSMPARTPGGLDAVNVATDRSQTDAAAVAQAQGMKQAAGKLEQAATSLQQAQADSAAQQAALNDASKAVGDLPADTRPTLQLPPEVPASPEAKAQLAKDLSAAAGALRTAAARKAGNIAGTDGSQGKPVADAGASRQFVDFPRPVGIDTGTGAAAEVAAQTPARRQLVQRALAAAK
ncbi:MAG: hypothetical protein IPP14_11145 [Planctomycetes bacterium]|nr:hypothetical protein [Planctomycetota bacterium]